MEAESAAFYANPTFWVAVAFAGFIALLVWRRVPGLVAQALDERTEKIRLQLKETKKLRDEAAALVAGYKKKHAAAAGEAEAILKQAAEDARLFAIDAEKRAEAALQRQARAGEEKIAQMEANAVKEVKAAAVEAAVKTAEAALRGRLQKGQNKALIDAAIEDLSKR
ncbi:MAG TPA: F0F1 ATP synthase subunit B, partial [Sphingomonadales bacterium]|nr:F0F1 ATP synthase subunit B [Sphingomonadales bacterium]